MANNIPLVYLGGPIKGISFDASTEWRVEAGRYLARKNIHALSPMRSKDHLKGTPVLGDASDSDPLTMGTGIVCRDRNDVMRCDLVLMNLLGATDKSIGSCVEFGWADAFRKPIITIMMPEDVHWHSFIRQLSGFIVPTLEQALPLVVDVLQWGW